MKRNELWGKRMEVYNKLNDDQKSFVERSSLAKIDNLNEALYDYACELQSIYFAKRLRNKKTLYKLIDKLMEGGLDSINAVLAYDEMNHLHGYQLEVINVQELESEDLTKFKSFNLQKVRAKISSLLK